MNENRRNFIKKSASVAAALSVPGLSAYPREEVQMAQRAKPYVQDAGIKFALSMGPNSARVPFAKQIGANHAVSGLIRQPEGATRLDPWDPELIKATKAYWDKEGIKWVVVEGPPILQSGMSQTRIKLGLDGRDEDISDFIKFMKNLKTYGDVDIICYNWMPLISWARTNMEYVGRGGALMLEFDYEVMKPAPMTEYGEISKEQLWKSLEYFVKAVMPEAEKIGMRMSLHPDDPQVDVIQGVSRIVNTIASYDRVRAMYPNVCNGITFCQANFNTMPDIIDVPTQIRKWGSEVINFVHFRNLRDLSGGQRPSTHLVETFHDEGDMDMYECMKAYYETGFDGPMRPDHVPVMATEIEAGMRGGYTTLGTLFAIGYMRGLAESIAKGS